MSTSTVPTRGPAAAVPHELLVRVAARRDEALDICSFDLVAADGAPLPAFTAGAHVDVHLAAGLTRQYSLCNAPGETDRYRIAVLHVPDSRGGSRAMHATVQVGETLRISPPRNHFPLAAGARRSLLLAGGIGITPILGMAHQLAARGEDFELHYCTRSHARTAFLDVLRASPFAHRVHLHLGDGPAGQKVDLPALLAPPAPGTHLYVCGPQGFMQAVLDTARAQAWPEAQLHRESFGAAPVAAGGDRPFVLELARCGRRIAVAADRTALQALQQAGVEVASSCEQGVCGTCLLPVLAGRVAHRDLFLTPEEQARNDQFTPCCSRVEGDSLVLDL